MTGKLVDTNILVYLSQRKLRIDEISAKDVKLFISVITYMEAMGYSFKSVYEKNMMGSICSSFEIIQIEQPIVEEVIKIRQHHKIKLPDAIILATAVTAKLELITANTYDFKNIIPGLVLINPMV